MRVPLFHGLMLMGLLLVAVNPAVAQSEQGRERCSNYTPLRAAYFGDLHIHTKHSLDASTQDTRTSPAQAYQFAKGERLEIQPFDAAGKGMREIKLDRPLDFAAVTDHAELFGEVVLCNTPGEVGYDSFVCKVYRGWPRAAFFLMNMKAADGERYAFCGEDGQYCKSAASGPWQDIQQAAAAAYDESDACSFTSFVAYEWSAVRNRANNLHRNVIFRNDAVPVLPVSSLDALTSHQLYDGLDVTCEQSGTGCEAIIIPHNSNLSGGEMFQVADVTGKPIDKNRALQIARYETLVEIMQHKGSSECYFGAANFDGIAADELCAFEQLPYAQLGGNLSGGSDFAKWLLGIDEPKPDGGFLREVAREGLRQEQRLGVNPFKWGFIGSTDTHLGAPGAVEEDSFVGHGGAGVPAGDKVPLGLPDELEYGPGGLAVLWAEENTRDSLFDAMRRREAYGTSGPRIQLRFFGGWEYPKTLCEDADFVAAAYAGGVPMGGTLDTAPRPGAVPHFAVSALKDFGSMEKAGTPLQRVQIIKGWVDAQGKSYEQVLDVAGNPDNGASVDTQSCQTRGDGYESLCTVWRDAAFDPAQRAYYYARVIENPTCRWSAYICAANKVSCDNPETITEGLEGCCREDHRPVIQERAWSSPIWYSPAS